MGKKRGRKKRKYLAKKKRVYRRKNRLGEIIKKTINNIFSLLKNLLTNLPGRVKRYFLGSLMLLLALVSFLGFFNLAGRGGEMSKNFLLEWVGETGYIIPFIFVFSGFVCFSVPRKMFFSICLSTIFFLAGISGCLNILEFSSYGGKLGCWEGELLEGFFGTLVTLCVFFSFIIVALLNLSHILKRKETLPGNKKDNAISNIAKKILRQSKFKVIKVEPEKEASEQGKLDKKEEVLEGAKLESQRTNLPPLDLLEKEKGKAYAGDIKNNASIIKKTLENFGINVSMAEVNIGPTVTQYTFKPAEGVRLSKITGLSSNLALALAAHPIRIEAPIPGRSLMGIEIPNQVRTKVRLRGLIDRDAFSNTGSSLKFALGRDVAGNPVFADLVRLPHLLVAGATGTGKTIFLNSLILSLLYQNTPETLRLILVDPKRVEFSAYNDIPHLLNSVILSAEKSVSALNWLVDEMDRRFDVLSSANVRNIQVFNQKASKNKEKPLYYIVLIIDELADLIATRGKEIEARIVRIAQMARAVGIHLVLATQRPSTEVITGLIKANISSRVSFQLPTQIDSRTVLDSSGAERLLGFGDLLYVSPKYPKPKRAQGAYVSEKEVERVVKWIVKETDSKGLLEDEASISLREYIETDISELSVLDGKMKKDLLYDQAKEIVIRNQKASASLLQRRLQIGYVRAARILDMLEMNKIIGPSRGAKPRIILDQQERGQEQGFFNEEN